MLREKAIASEEALEKMHLDFKGSCREFGHPQEKVDVSSLRPTGWFHMFSEAATYLRSVFSGLCWVRSIWVLDTIITWLGLHTYVRYWSSWARLYLWIPTWPLREFMENLEIVPQNILLASWEFFSHIFWICMIFSLNTYHFSHLESINYPFGF